MWGPRGSGRALLLLVSSLQETPEAGTGPPAPSQGQPGPRDGYVSQASVMPKTRSLPLLVQRKVALCPPWSSGTSRAPSRGHRMCWVQPLPVLHLGFCWQCFNVRSRLPFLKEKVMFLVFLFYPKRRGTHVCFVNLQR